MSGHEKDMQRCACGNLRRTARAITQYYDSFFEELELRSTQWSLLTRVYMSAPISIGELAEHLLMDQTTVTRNVGILKKLGYITVATEAGDARRRTVNLTESGLQKLKEALPQWEKAQSRIEDGLGEERFQALLTLLKSIDELVK